MAVATADLTSFLQNFELCNNLTDKECVKNNEREIVSPY